MQLGTIERLLGLTVTYSCELVLVPNHILIEELVADTTTRALYLELLSKRLHNTEAKNSLTIRWQLMQELSKLADDNLILYSLAHVPLNDKTRGDNKDKTNLFTKRLSPLIDTLSDIDIFLRTSNLEEALTLLLEDKDITTVKDYLTNGLPEIDKINTSNLEQTLITKEE